MIRHSKRLKVENPESDIMLVFTRPAVNFDIDSDVYDSDAAERIKEIVDILSEDIAVDRSFVDYPGSKYVKTFISNKIWGQMCRLLADTDFGKTATIEQRTELFDCYASIISCYMYGCFSDLGWDCSALNFYVDSDSLNVSYFYDSMKEWERYPGRWQTWYLKKNG